MFKLVNIPTFYGRRPSLRVKREESALNQNPWKLAKRTALRLAQLACTHRELLLPLVGFPLGMVSLRNPDDLTDIEIEIFNLFNENRTQSFTLEEAYLHKKAFLELSEITKRDLEKILDKLENLLYIEKTPEESYAYYDQCLHLERITNALRTTLEEAISLHEIARLVEESCRALAKNFNLYLYDEASNQLLIVGRTTGKKEDSPYVNWAIPEKSHAELIRRAQTTGEAHLYIPDLQEAAAKRVEYVSRPSVRKDRDLFEDPREILFLALKTDQQIFGTWSITQWEERGSKKVNKRLYGPNNHPEVINKQLELLGQHIASKMGEIIERRYKGKSMIDIWAYEEEEAKQLTFAEKHFEGLIVELKNPDWFNRARAIRNLAQHHGRRALGFILEMVKDPEEGVREVVVEELGRIGTGNTKVAEVLRMALIQDEAMSVKRKVLEAFVQLGDSVSAEFARAYIDKETEFRRRAAELTSKLEKGRESLETFRKRILDFPGVIMKRVKLGNILKQNLDGIAYGFIEAGLFGIAIIHHYYYEPLLKKMQKIVGCAGLDEEEAALYKEPSDPLPDNLIARRYHPKYRPFPEEAPHIYYIRHEIFPDVYDLIMSEKPPHEKDNRKADESQWGEWKRGAEEWEWNKEDFLLVKIIDEEGGLIGSISLDNPLEGKTLTREGRITKELFLLLETYAKHLAFIMEHTHQHELATRNGLTGLYNYAHFEKQLGKEIEKARRKKEPLSLIMIDIDRFKGINTTYGHLMANYALQEIASMIHQTARKLDIVARWGGEEFALILPGIDQAKAEEIAERLRRKMEDHKFHLVRRGQREAEETSITISVGLATYRSEEDQNKFFSRATEALATAKDGGRNKVCIS